MVKKVFSQTASTQKHEIHLQIEVCYVSAFMSQHIVLRNTNECSLARKNERLNE
jgi:hypothetical protein